MLPAQLDMPSARYAFASKARGIYLISNCRNATIYRVRATREHIESAAPTYRQRRKGSKNRRFYPFTLAPSACNMGLRLAHNAFCRLNVMLALVGIFDFFDKRTSPIGTAGFLRGSVEW